MKILNYVGADVKVKDYSSILVNMSMCDALCRFIIRFFPVDIIY